jgi:hypothetical protein
VLRQQDAVPEGRGRRVRDKAHPARTPGLVLALFEKNHRSHAYAISLTGSAVA